MAEKTPLEMSIENFDRALVDITDTLNKAKGRFKEFERQVAASLKTKGRKIAPSASPSLLLEDFERDIGSMKLLCKELIVIWDDVLKRGRPEDIGISGTSISSLTNTLAKVTEKLHRGERNLNKWSDLIGEFLEQPEKEPPSLSGLNEVLKKLQLSKEELLDLQERAIIKKGIIVEGNLLEIPIADYSRGLVEKTKNYVVYEKDGVRTEIGSMYGPLKGYDEKVFKGGICHLAEKVGDNYISNFSQYEMANLLQISISGGKKGHMERLRLALKRIGGLTITHTAFWVADGKEHKPLAMYPLFKAVFMPSKNDKERENYFVWNELIAKNLFDKYYKYIDKEIYLSLPSPISRRLYDYLEKKLGTEGNYHENIYKLMDKIPISEQNPTRRKEHLIKNLEIVRDTLKREKGITLKWQIKDDQIFFTRTGQKTKEEYEEEAEKRKDEGRERRERVKEQQKRRTRAFTKLVDMGVETNMLLGLFYKYDLDIIERQIKWLPYRKEAQNKAGLIVKAIKENYSMPTEYEKVKYSPNTIFNPRNTGENSGVD